MQIAWFSSMVAGEYVEDVDVFDDSDMHCRRSSLSLVGGESFVVVEDVSDGFGTDLAVLVDGRR